VEEPPTAQEEEETAHSLRARGVGAPATLGNFATLPRKEEMVVHLRLLGTSSMLHSHYLAMAVSLLDSQFQFSADISQYFIFYKTTLSILKGK
jgi:hypothetical protein